jgi:hypothetical protein
MEELPDDINTTLINNINDITDLQNLLKLNKYYYTNSIEKYKKTEKTEKYKNKLLELNSIYPLYVLNIFGDKLDKLLSCPTLDFKPHFLHGFTGYIDGIRENDVSHPIMKGTDKCGRQFITFKFKFKEKEKVEENIERYAVSTLFKRYTNYDSQTWVFGTSSIHLHENTCPSLEDIDNYQKVINGETVEMDRYFVSL